MLQKPLEYMQSKYATIITEKSKKHSNNLAFLRFFGVTCALTCSFLHGMEHAESWTALHDAAYNDNMQLAKNLLFVNAFVNAQDSQGRTPVLIATDCGHLKLIQLLFRFGKANVNIPDNTGWTPLLMAAARNIMPLVEELLNAGAQVNVHNDMTHWTPLHWAAQRDNEAMVCLLLTHDADTQAEDILGRTPLRVAHSQAVKQLLNPTKVVVPAIRAHKR